MYLGMAAYNTLVIPKEIFRDCSLDIDKLTNPKGAYRFEEIRSMVSELLDQTDMHIVGEHVMIDFPRPGSQEKQAGGPRRIRTRKRARRWGVSAAALHDGTYDSMHDADFHLSQALTRMLLDKIEGNPKKAMAVLDALDPDPAEVPLLLHLGKHLSERVESKEAAAVVLRCASTLAPDSVEMYHQLAEIMSGRERAEDSF